MKGKLAAVLVVPLLLGVVAAEAHGVRYTTARVIAVEPVYRTVIVETPVTACRQEIVERRVASGSVGGQTLAGAIVGAAIGRQFGDGSGRDALTLIGAVAGSAVANERAIRRQGGAVTVIREPVERCTTRIRRRSERQITGYWVDYRHRGRIYRVLSHEHPGSHVRVVLRS